MGIYYTPGGSRFPAPPYIPVIIFVFGYFCIVGNVGRKQRRTSNPVAVMVDRFITLIGNNNWGMDIIRL